MALVRWEKQWTWTKWNFLWACSAFGAALAASLLGWFLSFLISYLWICRTCDYSERWSGSFDFHAWHFRKITLKCYDCARFPLMSGYVGIRYGSDSLLRRGYPRPLCFAAAHLTMMAGCLLLATGCKYLITSLLYPFNKLLTCGTPPREREFCTSFLVVLCWRSSCWRVWLLQLHTSWLSDPLLWALHMVHSGACSRASYLRFLASDNLLPSTSLSCECFSRGGNCPFEISCFQITFNAYNEFMLCYDTKRSNMLGNRNRRGHWEESTDTICVWTGKGSYFKISFLEPSRSKVPEAGVTI